MIDWNTASKICIIGNAGGGKTRLARHLGQTLNVPVTHVDSIQFLKGLKIRPHKESIEILKQIQSSDKWILDGYGPLDILQERFLQADLIIYIDLPLKQHQWWCLKRQITGLFSRRKELPEGCDERSWAHTKKLLDSVRKEYRLMRPELLRILGRPENSPKCLHIKSVKELKNLHLRRAESPQVS